MELSRGMRRWRRGIGRGGSALRLLGCRFHHFLSLLKFLRSRRPDQSWKVIVNEESLNKASAWFSIFSRISDEVDFHGWEVGSELWMTMTAAVRCGDNLMALASARKRRSNCRVSLDVLWTLNWGGTGDVDSSKSG